MTDYERLRNKYEKVKEEKAIINNKIEELSKDLGIKSTKGLEKIAQNLEEEKRILQEEIKELKSKVEETLYGFN